MYLFCLCIYYVSEVKKRRKLTKLSNEAFGEKIAINTNVCVFILTPFSPQIFYTAHLPIKIHTTAVRGLNRESDLFPLFSGLSSVVLGISSKFKTNLMQSI